jgi:hypothetical protein
MSDSDPNALPWGSRLLVSDCYVEYDIDVYERPDRLIHFVATMKGQPPPAGGPAFAKLLDRANVLAVRAAGRPCARWTLRTERPPAREKPR